MGVNSTAGHPLRRLMPANHWLGKYDPSHLPSDLVAGLVVAIMLVPQGLAYALLAGLPAEVGLYASIVPVALYALFGTSTSLAVGPVAIVSLLVVSGISQLAETGSAAYFTASAISICSLLVLLGFRYAAEPLMKTFGHGTF